MKKYYEILGLNEDATLEEVNDAFTQLSTELYLARRDGKVSRADYAKRYDELELAREAIIEKARAEAAEAALATEVSDGLKEEPTKTPEEENKESESVKVVRHEVKEEETGAKKAVNGWKVATGVLAVALAAVIAVTALRGCSRQNNQTGAEVTNSQSITESIGDTPEEEEEIVAQGTPSATESTEEEQSALEKIAENATGSQEETQAESQAETQSESQAETQEDYSNRQVVIDLGNVEDDTLVRARAQELVDQMNAAGIVNPVTTVPYTVDEVFVLIKYANGVYTPATQEEIDVLHLNLLNIMIAQLNTDDYLYHVVYASGNDDFTELLNPNPATVGLAEAFCAYGENGVYPLVRWFEQKRIEIYSTTDREEINRIYREVGQVMADLMKGNGCTIVLYEGKDAKDGIEYRFTSEQVLAHHASALQITTDFQLIMANHYEKRNELDEVVDQVDTTWEVYNKLNSDGVDANGQPIINPDQVTYDEMNAWVNNGCDYEWGIDEAVLLDGQTFGQRIQGDMEGMAQNNYAMQHGGSLKK